MAYPSYACSACLFFRRFRKRLIAYKRHALADHMSEEVSHGAVWCQGSVKAGFANISDSGGRHG